MTRSIRVRVRVRVRLKVKIRVRFMGALMNDKEYSSEVVVEYDADDAEPSPLTPHLLPLTPVYGSLVMAYTPLIPAL